MMIPFVVWFPFYCAACELTLMLGHRLDEGLPGVKRALSAGARAHFRHRLVFKQRGDGTVLDHRPSETIFFYV
jgi:hypothetical protein